MKLRKLLKDIPEAQVKGSKDIEITGVCANSRLIAPGNLFIAKRGGTHDGNRYIPEAISAGAAAVLTDIYDPSLKNIVQVIHPNAASIEGLVTATYYQFPSQDLFMVGVTGTNGKTTTATLIKHLLDTLQEPCGLIGTIEYIIGEHRFEAQRTTPDVCANHKMLREMIRHGCRAAAMEVTSHALHQDRVAYIDFDIAIFTNLTQDHLDYHQTMQAYAQAKNLLFRSLPAKSKKSSGFIPAAIVNRDSPWCDVMLEGCTSRIISYSIDAPADLKAEKVNLSPEGTHFQLTYKGETAEFVSPMSGRFNLYNCLAAIGVGVARGVSLKRLAELLRTFTPVPGRLEPVKNVLGLKIYVDYAHTEDALRNVLSCLQEVKRGRVITVFGCGGDRDRSKRPKMAQAAEALSDITIVTSDNPRSEKPESILAEVTAGFVRKDSYMIEIDRRSAIERAVQLARPEDIILIAGKGHETRQVFAHQTIDFDDRLVAAELCAEARR